MRHFIQRLAVTFTYAVMLVLASGCHIAGAGTAVAQPFSLQLIIKFKPRTIACERAEIAHFSSMVRVRLEYVRAMSGDACVVRQFADSAAGLSEGQKILKQNPAIDWFEQDAVMNAS